MEAYSFTYSKLNDPSSRWTAGIIGNDKDDCIKTLARSLGFRFQLEAISFLGHIHAVSDKVALQYVKKVQDTAKAAAKNRKDYEEKVKNRAEEREQAKAEKLANKEIVEQTEFDVTDLTEDNFVDGGSNLSVEEVKVTPSAEDLAALEEQTNASVRNEVECKFCGKVLKGKNALLKHEATCAFNPHNIKKMENKDG